MWLTHLRTIAFSLTVPFVVESLYIAISRLVSFTHPFDRASLVVSASVGYCFLANAYRWRAIPVAIVYFPTMYVWLFYYSVLVAMAVTGDAL